MGFVLCENLVGGLIETLWMLFGCLRCRSCAEWIWKVRE